MEVAAGAADRETRSSRRSRKEAERARRRQISSVLEAAAEITKGKGGSSPPKVLRAGRAGVLVLETRLTRSVAGADAEVELLRYGRWAAGPMY